MKIILRSTKGEVFNTYDSEVKPNENEIISLEKVIIKVITEYKL